MQRGQLSWWKRQEQDRTQGFRKCTRSHRLSWAPALSNALNWSKQLAGGRIFWKASHKCFGHNILFGLNILRAALKRFPHTAKHVMHNCLWERVTQYYGEKLNAHSDLYIKKYTVRPFEAGWPGMEHSTLTFNLAQIYIEWRWLFCLFFKKVTW